MAAPVKFRLDCTRLATYQVRALAEHAPPGLMPRLQQQIALQATLAEARRDGGASRPAVGANSSTM